jgi:hypothetical protein
VPDRRPVILVAAHPRYGMWPGGEAVCLSVEIRHGETVLGEGWWLCDAEGRQMELRPYRLGMLRGVER